MRKVLICFLTCIFLLFNVSTGVAEEEEKKEEKTVLEEITVTGTPITNPVTPIDTRYGTQYNLVTDEQIKQQNSYDFESTLRNVPGVMFQKKNLIGEQTSHSLYIRGRGPAIPAPILLLSLTEFPALEHSSARCWVTASPSPPSAG